MQQFSSNIPADGQADNTNSCNCTRGHAYRFCSCFSKHFWDWFEEGEAQSDLCTCPPMEEALLALGCPRLMQHAQVCPSVRCGPRTDYHSQDALDTDPSLLDSTTGAIGMCSCRNPKRYISIRCILYKQHLNCVRKGKARSPVDNPMTCSCARFPFLVSRSCMPCSNENFLSEVRPFQTLDNATT